MKAKFSTYRYILFLIILFIPILLIAEDEDKPKLRLKDFNHLISGKDSSNSLYALEQDINEILSSRALSKSSFGIAVYSLDNDQYYYKKNIDKQLTPASNTKLFTTYACLATMGKYHDITTDVYSTDTFIRDSVINGDLYIIGHGDALLSVNDVEQMADDILNMGIKKVTGNIYADGSYYDDVNQRIDYSNDKDRVEPTPPITALSIDNNKATVIVTAGSRQNRHVNVQLVPNSPTFTKKVYAKVRKRRRSIRVRSKLTKDGKQEFKVTGYLYPRRRAAYMEYIRKPELAVAGALKERLETVGLKVEGTAQEKKFEYHGNYIILSSFSRQLLDILKEVNKNSDNYLAESMFKMIGAYAGYNKNTAKGTRIVLKRLLDSIGIESDKIVLNDGSGLSRRNLVTPRAVIELLKAADKSRFGKEFRQVLAIAGLDGTLKKRMTHTRAENNLRGKTGTLRNVSALSGYITTLDGERIAFSFMFNGWSVGSYKAIENDLGILLSQFFYYNVER